MTLNAFSILMEELRKKGFAVIFEPGFDGWTVKLRDDWNCKDNPTVTAYSNDASSALNLAIDNLEKV